MSEAVAKAERRDLRRTVGLTGLVAIDQHANLLDRLTHNVEALAARVVRLEDQQRFTDDHVRAFEQEASTVRTELDRLRREVDAFGALSVLGRLRWLVRGTL